MQINLVGGFLGSGKTTAIIAACRHLMGEGKKVGVITNDQGEQQVDSAIIKALGISGREVAKSCFCCNFNLLDEHIESLTACDVIFAESVGSCTDLVATIQKPLRQQRPGTKVLISVFVDASLLASLLEGSSLFIEESVRYIFKKQMEEADLIIINKTDLLSQHQSNLISGMLRLEYPRKAVRFQNSLEAADVSAWLDALENTHPEQQPSLTLDYDRYGAGEAELAWLDKEITIRTKAGNAAVAAGMIISSLHQLLQERRLTIGHLKFFVDTPKWQRKVSITTTSSGPGGRLDDVGIDSAQMLINARVQTNPGMLKKLVDQAIAHAGRIEGCSISHGKWQAFKPGYPRPTHRIE